MNENEIKALFFAQYLGQNVFLHPDYFNKMSGIDSPICRPIDTTRLLKNWVKNGYLQLRDISQLKDEEVTLIGCHVGWGVSEENKDTVLPWVRNDLKVNNTKYGIYKDMFRLFGVLTDFTYLSETNQPITLTPADIISKGWAVIKK